MFPRGGAVRRASRQGRLRRPMRMRVRTSLARLPPTPAADVGMRAGSTSQLSRPSPPAGARPSPLGRRSSAAPLRGPHTPSPTSAEAVGGGAAGTPVPGRSLAAMPGAQARAPPHTRRRPRAHRSRARDIDGVGAELHGGSPQPRRPQHPASATARRLLHTMRTRAAPRKPATTAAAVAVHNRRPRLRARGAAEPPTSQHARPATRARAHTWAARSEGSATKLACVPAMRIWR